MKAPAAPHIQALTHRLFGDKAFQEWNSGSYHDSLHAMYVAEVVSALGRQRRYQPDRQLFLALVALLHDADPRPAGTPASVPRTLEWMWLRREWLQLTLGWTDLAFATALALIARTDFPFDTTPRRNETMFDGLSPLALYRNLLLQLDPEARAAAFEDAQLLRFADQCANYSRDFATASLSVDDLADEMSEAGEPVTRWDLDTATFLDGVGGDSGLDRRLAREIGLEARVFQQGEMIQLLPQAMRDAAARNQALFRLERKARATG